MAGFDAHPCFFARDARVSRCVLFVTARVYKAYPEIAYITLVVIYHTYILLFLNVILFDKCHQLQLQTIQGAFETILGEIFCNLLSTYNHNFKLKLKQKI